MVPVGFHEADEGLPGLGKIDDRFLDQHFEQAARLVAVSAVSTHALFLAQAFDLVVKRGFDVQQRTGDVEQGRLVVAALAADHFVDRGALVLHHAPRHGQTEHAQCVGDAVECFHLAGQRDG